MGLGEYKKIQEYINTVCGQVGFKDAHKDIKFELLDHMEEKIEELKTIDMNEDVAIEKVVSQMGDAVTIGKQLNKIHKTVPEWSILLIVSLLSVAGLLTFYFIISNGIGPSMQSFYRSAIYNIIGYGVAAAIYFFDYRILWKYSKHIYFGATFILMLTIFIGIPVNGMIRWIHLGPFSLDVTVCSLFLYTIALSRILNELNWGITRDAVSGLTMLIIPLMLYIFLHVFVFAVIYFLLFTAFMFLSKARALYILSIVTIASILVIIFFHAEPYRLARVMGFLHPEIGYEGATYVNFQILKILQSASLFGNGFTFPRRTLPVDGDYVFAYIIHTFGWIGGITVIVLAFLFILRMFHISRKVKNSFGSFMIKGFMLVFAIEFLWNILMILGWAPMVSVSLPFISYGGTSSIIQMVAVGLILSIYRRKTLLSLYNM